MRGSQDVALIDKIFVDVQKILNEADNKMPIIDLVDALEEAGRSSSDISFALAHLLVNERLRLNGNHTVSIIDSSPFTYALVS